MFRSIRWARGSVVTRGSSSVAVTRVAFVKDGDDVVDDQTRTVSIEFLYNRTLSISA